MRIEVVHVDASHRVDVGVKPDAVWTAIPTSVRPDVPERLVHFENAFREDETHDWSWSQGVLRYYSRCVERDEEAWLFLVYREG